MKIPSSQENPIDVANIWLCDKLCPVFRSLKMSANHITTLSLIFGVISLVFLWKYNWIAFAITYYISYMFDCMDGHYARKYKIVSKFGDYYDHIKDVIVVIGLILILIIRYKAPVKIWLIFTFIMVIFTVLMIAHLGCQEKLYPHDESPALNKSKILCPGNATKNIQYTKWFGCGTWTLIMIFSVLLLNRNRIIH